MRSSPQMHNPMADGISIRVRVRRADCTSKLEYGEPRDMVCTIVNWEIPPVGGNRRINGSPQRKSFVSQFRSRSSSKKEVPAGFAPTLFFQTRTNPGPTLEACCSLHSVSSYDSLDHSLVSDTALDHQQEPDMERFTCSTSTYPVRNAASTQRKKKNYSVPCSGIKTVEKVSSLFRGYRIFFATGSRGSYELEFENKNGMDIMMAFLQATLPAERFVNLESASKSVDASDTASYLSSLDVEKLTERLAEQDASGETMSERLRRSVGQVVSSIEEMSNSFGDMCCHGQIASASVAPFTPPDEKRDSPPSPAKYKPTINLDGYTGPMMEIDEEKSIQSSVGNQEEMLNKRRYLREYKLPSGLSVEMPE